ncbi:MAG TPA: hypothetical protein ACHBZ9_04480 [Arsenophonus nasoniae]|uniref:hypothetical protein n=1 Tax=Arsenophonus nasoniae TaxID=638 RepID=UPI00387A3A9B
MRKTALEQAAERGKAEIEAGLLKLGIVYQREDECLYGCQKEGLYIANESEAMKKELAGTKFENYSQYLKIHGHPAPKPIFIDGKPHEATFIPIEYCNFAK